MSSGQKPALREYYSNDNSYETLEGTIIEDGIGQNSTYNRVYISVKCESEKSKFSKWDAGYYEKGCIATFRVELGKREECEELCKKLTEGTKIRFTTAPEKYFWDGYLRPVVAIDVDGECILEYDQGKTYLLQWVENL